jgi:hypothetical protein
LADFQPLAGSKMAGHAPAAPSNRATPGCGLENAMTQNSPPPDHALARRTVLKGASLSNNRHLLWYATRNFLAAPAAIGS